MSSSDSTKAGDKPRRRGLTDMSLGWLAERMRRTERIKKDLEEGKYKVDSEKVASAIANEEN